MSDQNPISPYNITTELQICHENKGNDHQIKKLDWQTNSPRQHLSKCTENSMENMNADVRE